MKAEKLVDALSWLDDTIITEVTETMNNNTTSRRRGLTARTVVIAAVVAALMVTGVFAADLFGFRALFRGEITDHKGEVQNQISLTQPQDVPDGTDSATANKVAASREAWAEWDSWRTEKARAEHEAMNAQLPEVFRVDFGYSYAVMEPENGTCELRIFDPNTVDENGLQALAETRFATAEEFAVYEKVMEERGSLDYRSRYDFNYLAQSAEADAALEAIAGKYGLDLRDAGQVAWERDGVTAAELAEKTAGMGNAGNIFRSTPYGFDKVYWFNEGSFCVSYYASLSNGGSARCYGYNSMYSTLSSGSEVISWEKDLEAFAQRSYTGADGTELTVLSNGGSAYIYVYLDNSFFAMHITSDAPLSETDINAIADGLNYSLIGK